MDLLRPDKYNKLNSALARENLGPYDHKLNALELTGFSLQRMFYVAQILPLNFPAQILSFNFYCLVQVSVR